MTNYNYSDFDQKDARLREKQHACSHPSLKCSVCKLYIDHVLAEEHLKIEALEHLLIQKDEMLIKLGVLIIPYNDPCQDVIMKELIEKEKQTLIEKLYRHSELR